MLRRNKKDPAAVSLELRERALRTTAADLGLEPSAEHPRVYGVLMELGYQNGTGTLVCFADGSTSLYFSGGGGMIGGGERPPIAQAGVAFVRAADGYVDATGPTTTFPSPAPGGARFHVLTFEGGRTAEAPQSDLGERRHPLSGLFYAGQQVITQLRVLDQEQQARG